MWDFGRYEKELLSLRWTALGQWEQWMSYALSGGGKRLRPFLAWLSYTFYAGGRAKWEEVLPLLHAIELFHTFTLIHDDIMDKSQIRRGLPTLYRQTNENVAILIGDAFLISAYQQLTSLPPEVCKQIGEVLCHAALRVCYGQLLDLEMSERPTAEASMEIYLKMITEKTGALLGAALEAGGILAGVPLSEAQKLREVGEGLGRFFQLQDDYLDAFGEATGKVKGGDIAEGKKTFLWLWLWERASPSERQVLDNLSLSPEERRMFGLKLYEKYELRPRAEAYLSEVRESLEERIQAVACKEALAEVLRQISERLR
ncbi:MAG: polyprenyl synthetase family protein [Bacteroidia bacterium]|nr:polyprenyl synthetase family protein [Bacteroidia bacterium]MDW8015062.1 polyprenyl synthetase family protein [Bacteroidia bacterium]